jgi:hypothetical protein
MKSNTKTNGTPEYNEMPRRNFLAGASLALVTLTAIGATRTAGAREPDRYEAADMVYTVNVGFMERFGAHQGTLFYARRARTDERPPDGSLVTVWIEGDRHLLRFVGTHYAADACFKEVVTLEDGDTRKDFCSCEVEFEAIGRVVAAKPSRVSVWLRSLFPAEEAAA